MRRRWVRRVTLGLVVVLAGGAGWWAGRVATTSETSLQSRAPERVVATVVTASIGDPRTYGVTVTQPFEPVAVNTLPGVVTAARSKLQAAAGDILYTVGSQPVFAIQGAVPFYRDLEYGESGTDVRQLERFLVRKGLLAEADGEFGTSTTQAVEDWQRSHHLEPTGVVPFGTVMAVAELPAPLVLGEGIHVGALLAGGETAVSARSADPAFAISLSPDQAADVPNGATVQIAYQDLSWAAVVARAEAAPDGAAALVLTAPDGGVVCGKQCSRLPPDPTVSLLSTVDVTPSVVGPSVPAAAIRTDISGASYVTGADGRRVPVTVLGSGNGIAVVDGLDEGDQVVVLGGSPEQGG